MFSSAQELVLAALSRALQRDLMRCDSLDPDRYFHAKALSDRTTGLGSPGSCSNGSDSCLAGFGCRGHPQAARSPSPKPFAMKHPSNSIGVTDFAGKGAQLLAQHRSAGTGHLSRGYTALRH